ncbi:DUF4249 domain-containing protein [Niabella sp. 22666]|uniref:DUF4249 domain-containing protein n=1 Tax=Niabella sp. 22666 TaxID=3453954 RepID=UPI003F839B95
MNYNALHKTTRGRVICTCCLAVLITTVSCDKVIDLKLPDAEKLYVIEAVLSDVGCRVNLSQTLNLSDSNHYDIVSGADITITEDGRTPVKLSQVNGGYYRAGVSGRPGRSYTLRIDVNGSVFSTTSVVPQKVTADSFYITERLFFGKTRRVATVEFNDPPGLGNVYRFIQYVNTKKDNNIFITNDHLIDGRKTVYEMLVFEDEKDPLKTGDRLSVELLTITPFMYNYWYSLDQGALGQSQAASPANPVNPFGRGAVGYFSTHTVSSRSAILR